MQKKLKIFGHPSSSDRNNNIGGIPIATVSSLVEFEKVIEESVARGKENRYLSYAIYDGNVKIKDCSRSAAHNFVLSISRELPR